VRRSTSTRRSRNRLGIQWIKSELEDLSFKYLRPQDYAEIQERISTRAKEKERFIVEVVAIIEKKLKEAGFQANVTGRLKHVYSIWRKMRQLDVGLDEIHDVIGFRVIVESWRSATSPSDRALPLEAHPGTVQGLHRHPQAEPVPVAPHHRGRSRGERIEVQIRTQKMHEIAEEGVAAHWAYKEKGRDGKGQEPSQKEAQEYGWLRQLVEWQRDLSDPREFLETVKVDLFSDEVFVFTPKGT